MLEIKSWHLTWGGPKSKSESKFTLLAWPFTLQNHNIMISWDFLRLAAPASMPGHLGAVSL